MDQKIASRVIKAGRYMQYIIHVGHGSMKAQCQII